MKAFWGNRAASCLLILGLLATLLIVSCAPQHLRTGETSVAKARPSRSFLVEDIASAPFLLEARGFSLSDYGDKLPAASTDLGLLGAPEMRQLALRIYAQAEQQIFALELRGDSQNSNEVQALRLIQAKVKKVDQLLPLDKVERVERVERSGIVNEVYFSLLDQRVFLEQAEVVLQSLKATFEKEPAQARNPEFILRYFGVPLISKLHYERYAIESESNATRSRKPGEEALRRLDKYTDTNQLAQALTNISNESDEEIKHKPEKKFFYYFDKAVADGKIEKLRELPHLPGLDKYTDTNQLAQALTNIANESGLYVQDSINLAEVFGVGGKTLSLTDKLKRSRGLIYKGDKPSLDDETIMDMFARLTRNGQKIRDLIDITIASVNRAFQQANYNTQNMLVARAQLEELNKEIKKRTRENRFHRLTKDSMLTIELKTLFLRYADNLPSRTLPSHGPTNARSAPAPQTASVVEQRGASILAMARVKSEESRDDSNYPILFEPEYAAAHFVNVHDRFVYGPQLYKGKAINFQFSVLHLRDLNNSNIMSGFKAVSGAVALANPEFAALSPVVNSLFSSILTAATKDQTELDCSFVIPPLEGDGKADTDFLIAETGHYILIKKENRFRGGLEDRLSVERDFYRKLIYNPVDSKLYHRKYYGNAEMNFTPVNLFTNQSYAVLVVTDEYTEPDDLAKIMREQVAKRLNDRRAASIIPNEAEARNLIDTLRDGLGMQRGSMATPSVLTNMLQNLKQELWGAVSDVRREFIVQLMSQNADEATRLSLGTDPEKWKRAALVVSKDGKLALAPSAATETVVLENYRLFVPGVPNQSERLFGNLGGLEEGKYFLLASSGPSELLALNESGWWGTLSDAGVLTPPIASQQEGLRSSSLRVTARRGDNQEVHAVRNVFFEGRPFTVAATRVTGATIVTNRVVVAANETVKLAVATNTDDPEHFSWRLEGEIDAVELKKDDGTLLQAPFTGSTVSVSMAAGKTNAEVSLKVRHRLFRDITSSTNSIQEQATTIRFGR